MVIFYSTMMLVPAGLTAALYFLLSRVISPIDAMAAGLCVGAAVSAALEFSGRRNHVFWIPTGVWMAVIALDLGRVVKTGFGISFGASAGHSPGGLTFVLGIFTAFAGVASLYGWYKASGNNAVAFSNEPEELGDNDLMPYDYGQRAHTHG